RQHKPMTDKLYEDRYLTEFPIRGGEVRLPTGIVAGNKLSLLFSELTAGARHVNDFSKLPIPFACVATDLVTGEAVVLTGGSLTEAMLASMAVPSVFSPIAIDGRLLVDGGVVRSVPAQDVVAMGADKVMVSMVSQQLLAEGDLSNVLTILAQSLTYQVASSNRRQLEYADVVIQPELGPLTQTDFGEARVIIRQGEIAARKQLSEILQLKADHVPVHRQGHETRLVVDSVYVSAFRV